MVQLLNDDGADVNPPMPGGKYSPLMSAIYWKHYDIIEFLITNGAQVRESELELAREQEEEEEDKSDMLGYLQLCVDLHSLDVRTWRSRTT